MGKPKNTKRPNTFLMPEEIGAMLRVPDRRTLQGKRDYAILKTLFSSGLRVAELCGLNVGDIETYRHRPVLRVVDKGKRVRSVPLHPKALGAIQAYWKADGRPTPGPEKSIFKTLGKHETLGSRVGLPIRVSAVLLPAPERQPFP